MSERPSHAPAYRARVLIVALPVAAGLALTGCSPHQGRGGTTPSPAATTPSPVVTGSVISTVPSVVPAVNAELEKLKIELPLEDEANECHPGHASTLADIGSQVCRWHPSEAGPSGYRILSVDVELMNDAQAAHESLSDAYAGNTAARPVTLGDEAKGSDVRFIETAIKIRGKYQSIPSSGARITARVKSVSVDVVLAGADYTVGAQGTPTHVTGLEGTSAARQATAIVQAIIRRL